MPPFSATPLKTQRICCSGRTQTNGRAPQRIDLGHGKPLSTLPITSRSTSVALRPFFSITAK